MTAPRKPPRKPGRTTRQVLLRLSPDDDEALRDLAASRRETISATVAELVRAATE